MGRSTKSTIVASMFYKGDDVMLDADGGRIDEQGARKRIETTNRLSQKHGVPFVLDLEIPSVASATAIIKTVGECTDAPMWISSFDADMRVKAVRVALEAGFRDRVYYSTLNYMSGEDEFRAVADLGVRPVIQIFNPDDPLPEGYLAKAEEFLALARRVGVAAEEAILLPTILDFGSIALVMETIGPLHRQHGLPVCVPSVGPVYTWAAQQSQEARRLLLASVMTYTLAAGADQLHIGSIKRSFFAFPVVALVDGFEKRRQAFGAT
jgi:tetrahydromethanopterin S-methyltransferase subunit H